MEGATIVMQDPYNLSTKFREYKDYELVSLPVGQSALTYLSLQTPELPNACLPRSGDATYSGPGMHVVVLSSLVDSDLPVARLLGLDSTKAIVVRDERDLNLATRHIMCHVGAIKARNAQVSGPVRAV